ncbi:hypothetical protein [Paenibacillus segetis]|nr:hypothetical protein [Paenibacillus segetis]
MVSTLAFSMLTASLGTLPIGPQGLLSKLNVAQTVNAAELDKAREPFFERLNELYAALASDPAGLQDVFNLRDEIAGYRLAPVDDEVISPIWAKVRSHLPESVDPIELRDNIVFIIRTASSLGSVSDLEQLRNDPEFIRVLKAVASASGHEDIGVDDFLVFLLGDGESRKGLEGTVSSLLENMQLIQLIGLIGNSQATTEVLLQASDQVLGNTEAYKFSLILNDLGISSSDVRLLVTHFKGQLKTSDRAINALTMAYVRASVEESVQISEDGRQHTYSLKALGIDIPSMVLKWSKVSGDDSVKVAPSGVITIPEDVESGTAVVRAQIVNPLSGKGVVIFEKEVTLRDAVPGEETVFPVEQFLERMNKLHAALAAGDPTDIQDVRNLRDEIAGLDITLDQALIDPLWNKIESKLPANADRDALKTSLFEILTAVGSIHYDSNASELEGIRTNPKYRATLNAIGAAGGDAKLVIDDFLLFMFGDSDTHKGIEGTVRDLLASMTPAELAGLLGNNQAMNAVILQASNLMLSDTESYKISAILGKLDITSLELGSTVFNYNARLQNAEPATRAMTVAYMRSETKELVNESEDGRQHIYSLKVLGIDIPAMALEWSKVSGSDAVSVSPNGIVTIPKGVANASAVIQAKLLNPYSGAGKVIFESEVTLTASAEEGNTFPVELFLEGMNKLRTALHEGGSSDVKDVRKLYDEIIGLNSSKDQALIDPIWKPIAAKLPASVDKTKLKKGLFDIIKAVGSVPYDVEVNQLEAILSNPEFQTTLDILSETGGVNNLKIDDFLILLFGDGANNKGAQGSMRDTLENMSSKELARLLSSKSSLDSIKANALTTVLKDKENYALSEVLNNLGVKPVDVTSTVQKFKNKLKYDEKAATAMSGAFFRSETDSTVKITDNGRQHQYTLTVLGVEISSSNVKWKKTSGSKDVKVDSNGKVTISKKIQQGTAVMQASLTNYLGGGTKVVYTQEVTLINGVVDPEAMIQNIIQTLQTDLAEIKVRLRSTTNDAEKIQLLVEVAQAGKDCFDQIQEIEVSKSFKDKAIKNVKNQVTQMTNLILQDLMKY